MVPTLTLNGSVHVAWTADTLYDDLASVVMHSALEAVQQRGVFHVALSGGSTPEHFYVRLVIDPRFRMIPWQKSHIWIVDERCVPLEDDQSNYHMIRQTLIDHVPIRKRCTHPMRPTLSDAADAYETEIREEFDMPNGLPQLDFVLLGMGADAHTASLFPNSPGLKIQDRLVTTNEGDTVMPPPRLTMTFSLINAAREIGVLVTGAEKAPTIRRVGTHLREIGPDLDALPITGVEPTDGELTWYLDPEAAGR